MKPSGFLETTDPATGGVVQTPTVQCAHCGRHWLWVPGSGRKRGRCLKCYGLTCGAEACDVCVPYERQIENLEQGRPADTPPLVVVVSGWGA